MRCRNLNADGSFTYTPSLNYNGSDSFTFQANDGSLPSNTATVSITVNSVNDAPLANDGSFSTDEDTAYSSNVTATDIDGPSSTYSVSSGPANGTLNLNADGSFSYTPIANFNGSDSFTFQASDGSLTSNIATVTISVNAVNDPPTAVDDYFTLDEDTPVNVANPGVLFNDGDLEGSLSANLVSSPAHGTLNLNLDGSFSYTPDADFHGSDSFSYQAYDGSAYSGTATVNLTVNPINDAPVLAAVGNQSVVQGLLLSFTASATDVDDSPINLTFSLIGAPDGATIGSTDGVFTWTPNEFQGPGDYSITVRVSDANGLFDEEVILVTVL